MHSDGNSPTTLKNEPGASYLIESDSGIDNLYGGQTVIDNAGTIRKTAGTGTSTLSVNGPLINTGTIEADSGTLYLNAELLQPGFRRHADRRHLERARRRDPGIPPGTNITSNAANDRPRWQPGRRSPPSPA